MSRSFLRSISVAIMASLLAACRVAETGGTVPFRSSEAHLEATLPVGWAAADGPERLARPFVGLVACNSWGESDFWAPEVTEETTSGVSRRYAPRDILGQIPAGGAYVVLVQVDGGPPAEEYGPEYEQRDLNGLWKQQDCRKGDIAPGATYVNFYKWGRLLRLEVYCTPDVSEGTAAAVNELLASWRFDRVPVGDVGWAVVEARQMLPLAVEPAKFPVPSGPFLSSMQQGSVTRLTQAEIQDESLVLTFMYRWDEPSPGSDDDGCPEDRCHWWRFEARPDGEIVLIEEGGATLTSPSETITPTLSPVVPLRATPLARAPAIHFAGWSPDSRWVAYWVSLQEDVDDYLSHGAPGFPAGTLHFTDVDTIVSCAAPASVTRDPGSTVQWSAEGAVMLVTPDGVLTGSPCQTDPYTTSSDYTPTDEEEVDLALSPDGRYRAATVLQSSEGGILTFETTIATHDGTQLLQTVAWQIDQRLGEYGLGGEWISRNQFLIYETLSAGPLLVGAHDGVIAVATELLGLQDIPSILDDEGYGLRAVAAPELEPDAFHLLLTGVGLEENHPAVMLYHANSEVTETLPYRAVWWTPFSADGEWLLMDERPEIDGYEGHAIWIRRVQDVGGEWQLLAAGVDSTLWNTEWTEMAFYDDAVVTWQTFPEAELIGRWDTSPFWTHPVAWSPDGRFLVTEGTVPGLWQYGLFVLEPPTRAQGVTAAIDCR
jgi:hypothetical protein